MLGSSSPCWTSRCRRWLGSSGPAVAGGQIGCAGGETPQRGDEHDLTWIDPDGQQFRLALSSRPSRSIWTQPRSKAVRTSLP